MFKKLAGQRGNKKQGQRPLHAPIPGQGKRPFPDVYRVIRQIIEVAGIILDGSQLDADDRTYISWRGAASRLFNRFSAWSSFADFFGSWRLDGRRVNDEAHHHAWMTIESFGGDGRTGSIDIGVSGDGEGELVTNRVSITLQANPATGLSRITISADELVVVGLPTSDPGVSGQLWSDGGSVEVA